MRSPCTVIVTVAALVAANGSTLARSTQPTPVQSPPGSALQQESCHPSVSRNAPTLGENKPGKTLSEQLAQSNGVICPPSGVDPHMAAPPPPGGNTPVIPPPGTPGGNQNLQPK
jgi:hypothetical protein